MLSNIKTQDHRIIIKH